MNKRSRGFEDLVGRRIVHVDASAVNEVLLTCEDGAVLSIGTEPGKNGVQRICLNPTDPPAYPENPVPRAERC